MLWNINNRKRVKFGKRIVVYLPEHPKANQKGYIGESRVIIENIVGRILGYNECVHHKNGNTLDNRVSNLKLQTRGQHTKHHNHKRGKKMAVLQCPNCLKVFEKPVRDTQLQNKKTNTFCSKLCSRGFLSTKLSLKEKIKRTKNNIKKVYRKLPE